MCAMTDESVDRFIKSLVKNKPAAAPVEPPPTPPAKVKLPVVNVPENPEAKFRKRYDEELDGIIEFEHHPNFFDESDVGIENAKQVVRWIHQQGKLVSKSSVAEGIDALRDTLTPLRQPEPTPLPKAPTPTRVPIAVTQPVTPVAPAAPPQQDPEAGLPQLPPYIVRILGSNKLRTRKDVRAIPSALFSDLYKGPHAAAFKARIEAAAQRF